MSQQNYQRRHRQSDKYLWSSEGAPRAARARPRVCAYHWCIRTARAFELEDLLRQSESPIRKPALTLAVQA